MIPVLCFLVGLSTVLFLVSLKFKRLDIDAHLEDLNIRHAAEMYGVKKRLDVLEEELLMEVEE